MYELHFKEAFELHGFTYMAEFSLDGKVPF